MLDKHIVRSVPSFGDIPFALRSLARNPGFTITAIVSLGLGIGANSAIFTLADQLMLRLLPVKQPESLVEFRRAGDYIGGRSVCTEAGGCTEAEEKFAFAYPAYLDLRDSNPGALTGIAARRQQEVDVALASRGQDHGLADRATAELVSGNYFEVLGVGARIGRVLTPGDDRIKNGEPYVVLSHAFWQRRFAGDPSILNRAIDINGRPMTVVGVAQPGFHGFEKVRPADLFVPMMMKPLVTPTWDDLARRTSIWLNIFGRLSPGVDAKTAQSAMAPAFLRSERNDLTDIGANPQGAWEKLYLAQKLQLVGASQGLVGARESFAGPLSILAAMVGTLLLIACVNVSNLLLARSAARKKEIAIRLALGATRWRLVRLAMTESLLIAAGGGVFALFCSAWTASSLIRLLPGQHLEIAFRTTPDGRILAFTALVSLFAAVLFGLVPSLQASRSGLVPDLKNTSGGFSAAGGPRRLGRLLVAVQVTLSLSLLVTAGLFARSLYRLASVDTGINTGKLLQFSIAPSRHTYTKERSRQLLSELQRDLQHLPGAVSASASWFTLLANSWDDNTVTVEGYQPRPHENMNPRWNATLPEFFSTVGVPLIAGREFTEGDRGTSPKVVIVNETFVKRFLPRRNPLGRHIGWGSGQGVRLDTEIVGVVKDIRAENPKEQPQPYAVTPALQDLFDLVPPKMTFYVRTAGDPISLVPSVRSALRGLDPGLPMFDVKTVNDQIGETNFAERLFAMLSCSFAVLATLLASVGLYGVTAYSVARRRPEIGLRLALGAGRAGIARMILRQVAGLAAAGIAVGIPLALAFGRLAESRLFEMKGNDPAVLVGAIVAISAVAVLAGYLPARRAARINPIEALKNE